MLLGSPAYFEPEPPGMRERLITRIGGYSKLMYWYRSKRPRWFV